MTTAYDTDVRAERSTRINKEDTKYVYIPAVELQVYLKKYSEAKGVRVYFGVVNDYEIDGTTFNCNKEHKNQVTVILKANEKDSKKSHDTITPLIVLPKEKPLSGSDPIDEFGICPPLQKPVGSVMRLMNYR